MAKGELVEHKDCGLDGLTFTQPSLTRMEFAEECDLHNIIERFLRTGVPPNSVPSMQGDLTTFPDSFDELQNMQVRLSQLFEQQPLEVQEKYESPVDWYQEVLSAKDSPPPEKPVEPPVTAPVASDAPPPSNPS